MRSPLLAVLAASLALVGCKRNENGGSGAGLGQDTMTRAAELRTRASSGGRAFETAQSVSDEVGPRLAGSTAEAAGQAWGVRTMKSLGLANVHTEPLTVSVWKRGVETAAIVAPYASPLTVTALGGSVATPDDGIEAELIVVPDMKSLDALSKEKVAGKIVLVAQKMERSSDGHGYGDAVGARAHAASHAAKLGAVAALVRSIGTDQNRLPHTGAMKYDDDAPKIPTGALSIPDADMLSRIADTQQAIRIKLTLTPQVLPDASSANVVGEVVGTTHPDEIVLIGAHLDSWDLGRGAIDDGAGCAIMLEAGRNIAAFSEKPRRTVRVVLFANEENGLAGGIAYAKAHEAEMPKHVLAMEADAGAGRVLAIELLGGDNAKALVNDLGALVAPLGVRTSNEDAHGGADISPIKRFGVPFLDASQDMSRYFDFHHTANDTPDKIDRAEIDQAALAVTTLAFAAAHSEANFGRVPDAKANEKRVR